MKTVKSFKLANVALTTALAIALSGCGDDPLNLNGGSDAPEAAVSFSGTVADGYLSNATVCLDLNRNTECDDNEPTGISGAGGEFMIDATQSQINATPLLAEITSDTIDEDYPNKTLTPFTLSAPAGYTFVSPITTMIQNLIEQDGMTVGAAEETIKAMLGTTLNLKTDYIAGKISGSDEAEFDKLHKIAQVTARIIADKVAAPENANFSIKDLSTAIMVALIPELENITEQVEDAIEAGGDFDPDTLATEIGATIVIDIIETDTILDEYVLISSVGAESEITENMVIGEWSTGSKIAAGTYDGLNAWTITKGPESDANWGSVLALSDGFEGDFSNFNKLKLKIATSGGYAGGYAIAIKAGGVESGDIVLSVDDSLQTWQDVEIDLSDYDLSSIEFIAIYAIGGTANVSEIHIADLSLLEIEEKADPVVPVDPVDPVDPSTEDYVLISSAGVASEINENTVIGEWSTGSQIDAESTYEGLDAWTITSAVVGDVNNNNWGTVLSIAGGFSGDFSAYDQLKLKIATSGGYDGGYFMQISANGAVSGDIPLSVSDGVTGWQDVAVDLANYDLSSIESIAIFAIGGEANVSKIHIADLALGQDDSVPVPVLQEYALISSTGAESKINEATEVGEWSTGTQINAASNYEGLNAWSLTDGGSWGTVLALAGGFAGDFSDFNKLRLQIATSGDYAEGYFIKIGTGGTESADIPLAVSNGSTGWQNVEVDLADYDLSSIEYIAVFAKAGTANVSKLYIADLALVQLTETDTGTEPEPETVQALEVKKTAAASFVEVNYTTSTWIALTTALAMPETTQAEVIAKTEAITIAINGLEETGVELVEGPNLVVNGDFTDTALNTGGWGYHTGTGSVITIENEMLTAAVTTLGGQWDNQIFNEVQVFEAGAYIARFTASSTVDRDILFRIDGIEIAGAGPDSDVICHLTSTPTECTLNVADTFGLAGNPRLKIVLALGELEMGGTNSAASTVTIDDFYLGTLAEAVLADKTELETAIATAQVRHDSGADETLKAAYQAAINEAQIVVDNADATQTEADAALEALAIATGEFDPSLIQDPNNLVVNGNFSDTTIADNAGTYGEWNYYTGTGTVVAIADGKMTADVTTLGGQWENQIWNEVQVSEEGNYKLEFTASSSVERDILVRVDAIEMNGDGTTGPASDVIAHLTSTPQTFTKYFSGSAFAGNARFKVVTALGSLEAAGTTSEASTVTFDNVFLGTFSGELPTDTATLITAITLAQNLIDVAVEGTEEGQYDASKTDLEAAIVVAQAVADNQEVTQEQADSAVAALATARATFEAGLILPTIAGAQITTPDGDLNYTPDSWGTGTLQDLLYADDVTYSPSILIEGAGAWGTVLAITGIPAGTLADYDSIDFKVKTSDFSELKVKVPEVEQTYALTDGTPLANGWIQMSIPVSDFGEAPASADQFAIFGAGGTGTILFAEISFSLAP